MLTFLVLTSCVAHRIGALEYTNKRQEDQIRELREHNARLVGHAQMLEQRIDSLELAARPPPTAPNFSEVVVDPFFQGSEVIAGMLRDHAAHFSGCYSDYPFRVLGDFEVGADGAATVTVRLQRDESTRLFNEAPPTICFTQLVDDMRFPASSEVYTVRFAFGPPPQ